MWLRFPYIYTQTYCAELRPWLGFPACVVSGERFALHDDAFLPDMQKFKHAHCFVRPTVDDEPEKQLTRPGGVLFQPLFVVSFLVSVFTEFFH